MEEHHERILVVDDEADMCETIAADLSARGFQVTWRTSPEEAFLLLAQQEFDVVVTDLQMPGMSGVQLCERIVQNRPDIPVIVITAFGSMDTAIASIRAGAYDFLPKPFPFEQLAVTAERALRYRALQQEVRRLRLAVAETRSFQDLVGESPRMRELYDLVDRVAQTDSSVLVQGESGTGKELVARALHRRSARSEGPFVAINCAAMPEGLFESELFGHVKGAFTDARADRQGLFLQADGGTIFLDEVGELSPPLQSKLLRAIQERTIRPVGGDTEHPFDARIVAASNRDLETAIEEGRFREDLYFRLNVIKIAVPPLRARGTDVLVLAQHFLEHFAGRADRPVTGISAEAADKLSSYFWPGNVRELQNCIERAVALARYEKIVVEDLPEKIRDYQTSHVLIASDDPADLVPMEEVERRYVLRVMSSVDGNKSQAAKILGYDRKTLYRRLERYGYSD
jgi:two-component system, NtrC family, response regulator AtoC